MAIAKIGYERSAVAAVFTAGVATGRNPFLFEAFG
jgi:hypothetical protein